MTRADNGNEHQALEWKESWRDEYLKWICGFANADGGTLVIGRDNDGKVVGVIDAIKLLEDIPNKVRDVLGIMVDVHLRTVKKRKLVEIRVDAYPYPISYKGQYHYRSGSTKQELKGAALDRFLLQKQGKHWDGVPVPNVSFTDLDATTIRSFRQRAKQSKRLTDTLLDEGDDQLLDKLHLTEQQYLKRSALLLFHPDPQRFVTGASVKIGAFEGDSELLYHDEVQGNLFHQVETVMELLLSKYLKATITYHGLQRIERYPLPVEALREALMNAIAHKDYAGGAPIQISVYENKLIVWNEGQLPQGWSVQRLMEKHPSKPFNPDIANAFFRAGLIESWGRGIEKILQACAEHGVPAPSIRSDLSGLWIEFAISATRHARLGEGGDEKLGDKLGDKLGEKLGETRAAIIRAMIKNPRVSANQLAEVLGVSRTAVENQIRILRLNGSIRRIGPAKGGNWEVLDDATQTEQER